MSAALLLVIDIILVVGHGVSSGSPLLTGTAQVTAGLFSGLVIGIVAADTDTGSSVRGRHQAGRKLLVCRQPADGGRCFRARYSRDSSFAVLRRNHLFVVLMGAGSVAGTFVGGLLFGIVAGGILIPALAVILVLSAVKVWTRK